MCIIIFVYRKRTRRPALSSRRGGGTGWGVLVLVYFFHPVRPFVDSSLRGFRQTTRRRRTETDPCTTRVASSSVIVGWRDAAVANVCCGLSTVRHRLVTGWVTTRILAVRPRPFGAVEGVMPTQFPLRHLMTRKKKVGKATADDATQTGRAREATARVHEVARRGREELKTAAMAVGADFRSDVFRG